MPVRQHAVSLLSQLCARARDQANLLVQGSPWALPSRGVLQATLTGGSTATSSVPGAVRQLAARVSASQAASTPARHRQLINQFTSHIRTMGTSLAEVEPAVIAKARRMSGWVGGLAGLFGSFVGVGGGVLIGPIIANACRRLPQRVISGTSLAAVVAVGTTSGVIFWQSGYVDITSALVVASTAVLGSPLGASATRLFNCTKLRSMLGYWLLFVSPLVPLKTFIFSQMEVQAQAEVILPQGDSVGGTQEEGTQDSWAGPLRSLNSSDAILAAVGGIAGFASGLLGIGGGTIVTPLLALVTGMPQASVVGTSLAAMAVPAVAGLTQHVRMGNVDWLMALGLVAGSFAGSLVGSNIAIEAPPMALEMMFALGMAYLGRKTLRLAQAKA